jgi:hypothetical protein
MRFNQKEIKSLSMLKEEIEQMNFKGQMYQGERWEKSLSSSFCRLNRKTSLIFFLIYAN